MPRTFVHLAFILFIITGLSGLWMRLTPFFPSSIMNYEHILHAHSHIAILGWAFLGAFVILLAILWPKLTDKGKQHGFILTITIFVVSTIMFLAFLYEGYAMYSIIMSTIHIFVEYWAIYFIYRQLKKQQWIPKIGRLFINGSLITLFLSSLGPFLLGYLGATGMQDSRFFEMAIYYFLHFQYNGWLLLFLIGTFIIILHKQQIKLANKLFLYGFWTYFIALFPWFFSAISWTDISTYDKLIATTGTVGQWLGTIIIISGFIKNWSQLKQLFSKITLICLAGTFSMLFLKATMELGLISTPLATLVFDTRPVVIGYLHFTLLGFVSFFILTQYQMMQFINTKHLFVKLGLVIFIIGFSVNELILFMIGLFSWLETFSVIYSSEGLFISSVLLIISIVCLWYSLLVTKKQVN